MTTERRLHLDDLAALTGLTPKTLTSYMTKRLGPKPDGHDVEKGHARPWWRESTVRVWMAARPGRGWRKGQTAV